MLSIMLNDELLSATRYTLYISKSSIVVLSPVLDAVLQQNVLLQDKQHFIIKNLNFSWGTWLIIVNSGKENILQC